MAFKSYEQAQVLQLPVLVEELIPLGHLSRIIHEVVEQIDMGCLERYYAGGGSSSYHPRMMIKAWLYGYCEGIYTSRRLAKALREHIPFIWLAGGARPCFKTLSHFRSCRLEGMIDVIFKRVLVLLVEEGYIDLEDLYVDGSKWAANANRHKVIWRKNTERYKGQVEVHIEALLEQIQVLQAREDAQYGSRDLAQEGEGKEISVVLNSARVGEHLLSLQALIEENASDKAKQKRLYRVANKLQKEQQKLSRYEAQELHLAGRNSYSKTDVDATALCMKDEQILPAYNVQHTTTGQYIVNWTIEQGASDTPALPAHLDKMQQRQEGLELPERQNLAADAAYGSEENYADMESRKTINAYVKYPLFYQQDSGQLVKKPFRRENFPYNAKQDTFNCPQGRKLHFVEERRAKTDNGYERQVRFYQCASCQDCPVAAQCKKSEHKARTVSISVKGEVHKEKARQLLNSDKGRQMRTQRGIEVEGAFGDIKHNMKHRRFILRGKHKVYIEYGLLSIGHNLRKIYCQKSGCWAAYYAQRARKSA